MVEKLIEKWSGTIHTVEIGATKDEGGTRKHKIKIGGAGSLPFLHFEEKLENKPAIAVEVCDLAPVEKWQFFYEEFKEIVSDPILWAERATEWGADLICLKLDACHPDTANKGPEYVAEITKRILTTVDLPLIILGCGHAEKDAEILPVVSQAGKGEKLLIGMATKDNYRTIAVSCLADEHNIIAETPLDINLAKQLNLLISDMGIPLNRIVMHPTTAGLGYGFEYCYSIMERSLISGLEGDKTLAQPIINLISEETWKLKEAKIDIDEMLQWGELKNRAIAWELTTAIGYLQAGSSIVVVAHPETVKYLRRYIEVMYQ